MTLQSNDSTLPHRIVCVLGNTELRLYKVPPCDLPPLVLHDTPVSDQRFDINALGPLYVCLHQSPNELVFL